MHVTGSLFRLLAIHQILKVALMIEIYLITIMYIIDMSKHLSSVTKTISSVASGFVDRAAALVPRNVSTMHCASYFPIFHGAGRVSAFVVANDYVTGMEVDAHVPVYIEKP
jgi:hypothetical protein